MEAIRFSRKVVLTLGLLLLVGPRREGGVLTVTTPGNVSTVERGGTFLITVAVTNTDNFELDFALATITPNGPDLQDTAYFGVGAGGVPNGSRGLVAAPTFLLAGQTGFFTYSIHTLNMPLGIDDGLEHLLVRH